MKLTKKQESEIRQVYEAYFDSYLKGDVNAFASCLDDNFCLTGTTESELFYNKKEAVEFIKTTADQIVGKAEFRNRDTKITSAGGLGLVNDLADLYIKINNKWAFYSKIRISSLFQKVNTQWKIIHQHASLPDSKAQKGETIAFEKIKNENIELRDAVKRRTIELEHKNRDLEIEASLERVRATALGMRKSDDLLSICKILFEELHILGFSELRNAMINIHDDTAGSFLNYDFSDAAGATITNIFYNSHPATENLVKKIRKKNDAFAEFVIRGSELDKWREYRKKMGEEDDPQLDNVSALYYYFYSIGIGGIGISTYSSITEEKRNVLKRFRNVFDFAYRRYMDVALAEAQAKEAKLEASLERVRAQAMSMRKPDELSGVSEIVFTELKSLGFTELRNTEIIINNDNKESVLSYYYSDYGVTGVIEVFYNDHPKVKLWAEEMHKANDAFTTIEISENEIDEWKAYREEIGYLPDPKLDKATTMNYYSYSIGLGSLSVSSFKPITDEQLKILERFRNVFGLAYRRYADVAQAEAQAREAQIEASLERVRSNAMAMHNSEDLSKTVNVFFKELKSLGVSPWRCGVGLIDEETRITNLTTTSITKEGESSQVSGKLKQEGHPVLEGIYDHWKIQKEYFPVLRGNEIKDYYDIVNPQIAYPEYPVEAVQFGHMIYFKEGFVFAWTEKELSEGELEIFRKFTSVLSLTYRRYLDLKEAEAQAREAKIEASLERVRARSMAMHKSDELVDASIVLFNELKSLGIVTIRTGVAIVDTSNDTIEVWSSQLIKESRNKILGVVPVNAHPFFEGYYKAWKNKEPYFYYEIIGNEVIEYYKKMSSILSYPERKEFNSRETFYTFFFPEGSLNVVSQNNLSEYECNMMVRFSRVFGLIYRRFLDLKQAEAQTREAQIEAALEKVRGRAMAMHNSSDLSETASMVFTELRKLGINPKRCGVALFSKDSRTAQLYTATTSSESDSLALIGSLDMSAHQCLEMQFESWLKKENYLPVLSGEELKSYYDELSSRLSVPALTGEQFQHEEYGYYLPFSEGSFYAWTEKPYADNEINILNRFKAIIDLTFRRYFDLQKAEGQAREAQIEAALERVRSKAMGMQKSEDLALAVKTIFEELDKLNLGMLRCGIGIISKTKRCADVWTTTISDRENIVQVSGDESMDIHPLLQGAFDAWLRQDDFTYLLEGEDMIRYYEALTHVNFKLPDSESIVSETEGLKQYYYVTSFQAGGLFAFRESPFPEEAKIVMKRFADVFNLTYTRFSDLKQAEAQAREAKIETALERVRSRTMAMHHSGELAETAAVVFQQIKSLGINPVRLYIGIIKDDCEEIEFWATDEGGNQVSTKFTGSITEPTTISKMYAGWKDQKKFLTIEQKGKDLEDYLRYLSEVLNVPFSKDIPHAQRVQSIAYFSKGLIGIATVEEQPKKTTALLERFAGVFDLAYTRFLDLKQAELQTHKAQIEVALERARARALAMQEPEELVEVAQVLRHELELLGMKELETGTIFTQLESQDKADCWFAIKDTRQAENNLVSDHITLALNKTWVGNEMLRFYSSDKDQISIPMKSEHRKEWIDYCYSLSGTLNNFYGENIPDRTYHLYRFSNGSVGAVSPGDLSEEGWDVLKRAASVFSLAYSRFKDLTQARIDLQNLKDEKKRSDSLLLNILPEEIANELKQFGKSYARKHEQVSILFADIKGFSSIAENLSATELVTQLDECFRAFDNISEKHGMEKIKTIGDAYISACGLPLPDPDNAVKAVKAALDMIDFIKGFGMTKKIQNLPVFEFRVGIHTGPVITGVVGLKKFTYDIWGDAVNMAARMEQHGEAGKINISGNTYELVKDKFNCTHRGKIEAKNKGEVDMYFVECLK